MNFVRKDRYCELSEDGRYSVAAVAVSRGVWMFEAWQTREHPDGAHLIGIYRAAADARHACEQVEGTA